MTFVTYVYAYFANTCLGENASNNDFLFFVSQVIGKIAVVLSGGVGMSEENGSVWNLFMPLSSLECNILFKLRQDFFFSP